MKDFVFVFLWFFASICLAANIPSEQTDAEQSAPTSTTHGAIGDYVAVGLGISTRKLTSALAAKTSDDLPETISSSSRFLTSSDETVTLTSARAPDNVSVIADNIMTTSATDCWHSWLDYWSASSANHGTDTLTSTSTVLKTATDEFTKYWRSFVQTASYPEPSTIYSDGYGVSVSMSYHTDISSYAGWANDYDYDTTGSLLSAYVTTSTYNWSDYEYHTISRPITGLPVPSCELPAAVPECSMQWSSWIHSKANPKVDPYYVQIVDQNKTSWTLPGAPDCTQAKITGDWCTLMRSFYLFPQTAIGHLSEAGWETVSGTSYFPTSRSLAPGCSLGCQACSITGESVQILYWPPGTAAVLKNSTGTATLTPFAHNGSSIRSAIIDGTVLTSPTIYISYDILHAADSCGAVGKTYRNTILSLSNADYLFMLEKIVPVHGFSQGYDTLSFNFTDLIEPIPNSIYHRQERCKRSSMSWVFGHETHGNATFSCARTAPYAPIIEVPPEARDLDPAWSSCQAWYGGLFDPPKALQPADAIVVPMPISPTTAQSPAATPKPTVDSGLRTQTSTPVASKSRPQAEQNEHAADPTSSVAPESKAEDATNVSDAASRVEQTKASPSDSNHDPAAGPDTTTREASFADEVQESFATRSPANTQLDSSEGVAAILSMLLTQGIHGTNTDSVPQITPASDLELHAGPGVATSVGAEVHMALASQGIVSIEDAPVANGQATAFHLPGQSDAVLVTGHIISHSGPPAILAGQVITYASTGLSVVGATAPVIIDCTVYSASFLPAQPDAVLLAGHTLSQDEALGSNGLLVVDVTAPFTIDSTVFSASTLPDQHDAVLLAGHTLSQGEAPATIAGQMKKYGLNGLFVVDATASVSVIIDGTTLSATALLDQPDAVLLASHTLSQSGAPVTINGKIITYGPNGISVGDFATSSTATAITDYMASVVTIDDTAYTATPVLLAHFTLKHLPYHLCIFSANVLLFMVAAVSCVEFPTVAAWPEQSSVCSSSIPSNASASSAPRAGWRRLYRSPASRRRK